jgi:hypothetical protein
MALAQQKLDEIRNYTTQEELVANLKESAAPVPGEVFPEHAFDDSPTLPSAVIVTNCNFAANPPPYTTVPDSNNPIAGNNASYTRLWRYCVADSELLYAVVEVSWLDLDGTTQTVSMDSSISWKNPTASADLGEIPEQPLVPSATGRAYLGDGSVTEAQKLGGTNNNDGTTTVLHANDGADVALVDTDTNEIVLTLVDACRTQDGSCFGFVKISGRIYFDSSSSITPSSVYVLASDAAYCARVNATTPLHSDDDNNGDGFADGNGDGVSDYDYFTYTCYLGGGWYGNLGLLLTSGATSNDHVCVGDPTATADGVDAWRSLEVASRRVYRGMVYVREDDGSGTYPLWRTATGTATIGDIAHPPLYYSKGIGDSVQLPDPTWLARTGGHDYMVMRQTGQIDATACTTPLTRPDSAVADISDPADGVKDVGTLFAKTPTDFICLNDEDPANSPRQYPYLDSFNGDGSAAIDALATVHGAELDCPYDPSRPPSAMHLLTGTVTNVSAGAYDLGGTTINTSDGEYDCVIESSGTALDYTCQIYEWGDGWNGTVFLKPVPEVECTATSHTYTAITVDQATTAEDFTCRNLAQLSISGTISAAAQDLTGVSFTARRTDGVPGVCTTLPGATVASVDYACVVYEQVIGSGWSGTVAVTLPAGSLVECPSLSTTYSATSTTLLNEDYTCYGPANYHTVSGTIHAGTGVNLTGTTINGSTASVCTIDDNDGTTLDYHCTVSERGSGWTGSVTITPPSAVECSPNPVELSGVVEDASFPESNCITDLSGPFTLSGSVTTDDKLADLTSLTIVATETSGTGAASPATQICSPDAMNFGSSGSSTYSCVVNRLANGTTWDITVTYQTTKYICTGTDTGVASLSVTYPDISPTGLPGVTEIYNIDMRKLEGSCP